jgi:repressor LexA
LSATPGQLRVLREIARFADKHGYGPTVRDICSQLHISSPNAVHEHVSALRLNRFVDSVEGRARTLRVTELGVVELERHRLYVRASGAEVAR